MFVHGQDNSTDKGIHPEVGIFEPQPGGIKGAGDIAPIAIADQPLITVNQFLTPNLGGERELFWIPEPDESLVEIELVGFDIWVAVIARGGTVAAFGKEAQPGTRRVTGVDFFAEQQVLIIIVRAGASKIEVGKGTTVFFDFVTGAELAAEIPIGQGGRLLAEPIIKRG